VNAALNALVEQGSGGGGLAVDMWAGDDGMGMLKRKVGDDDGAEGASEGADKRRRGDSELEAAAFDLSALFAAGASAPLTHNPDALTLAMGAGTPMHGAPLLLRANSAHHAAAEAASDDDDDDWLLAMDQLVDTEALLIKSPPSTPVDASMLGGMGSALDLPHVGRSMGPDPFARWDRIPVNIFRRSRALASSHRRDIAAQHGLMSGGGGGMSALALTAIKSSRQRRALVNSTLLTQHTLLPPPPPPTPLGSRAASMGRASRTPSSLSTADSASYASAPAASPMRSAIGGRKSAGGRVVAADAAAEGMYAFGWLEDDDDLALFAMPELSTRDAPPSMTMMLAASAVSPMLRPFGSSADAEAKRQ
ncbi:hypothetical protein GGI24_001987, partial [Coemansia furcata]